MQFPTIVYRCPGPHSIKGGSYDYLGVKDQAGLDDALKAGWFKTMPEALEKKYGLTETAAPVAPPAPPVGELETLGDTTPPTREELETQAKKLGVKFKKNTTDEELLKDINAAMKG